MTKLYVRGAAGAIIVCDVMSEGTLQSTKKWKEIIEEFCDYKDGKPIPSLLVQNKSDLLSGLEKKEEFTNLEFLVEWGKSNGFFSSAQTSAKKDSDIPALFDRIIEEILKRNLIVEKKGNYEEKLKKEILYKNPRSNESRCCL